MAGSQIHPMEKFKKDQQIQTIEGNCYTCLMKVKGSDALAHLFFGRLQCANCKFMMSFCDNFMKNYTKVGQCSKTKKTHSMTKWMVPVYDYLIYCAHREIVLLGLNVDDKSKNDVYSNITKSYLRSLLPLRNIMPWKVAFEDPSLQAIMRTMVLESQCQKSECKLKIMPQSLTESTQKISSSLTSSTSHALPKFSPQKGKEVQERDKQLSTPERQQCQNNSHVTTRATKASLNAAGKEEESSKMKHDPPPATQAPKISTPQKRKTQNNTKDAGWDTSMGDSKQVVTIRALGLSDKNSSSDLSLSERKRKPGRKNKPYLDIIPKHVLHSMHYLVEQLSPQLCLDECPNCYYAFSAEMCNVNTSTHVVDLKCPNCDLAVYIVPKELYDKLTEQCTRLRD